MKIVIVGAGPTGLALACALRTHGVEVDIYERREGPTDQSRATLIHASTLELLSRIGVATRALESGLELSSMHVYDDRQLAFALGFDQLRTPFPKVLMLPQSKTESILLERLKELGGHVHHGVSLVAVQKDSDGLDLRFQSTDGRVQQVCDADVLVGCDGTRSLVREAAGIDYVGSAHSARFILADVCTAKPLAPTLSFCTGRAGYLGFGPIAPGVARMVASDTRPENALENAAALEIPITDLQSILDTRLPSALVNSITQVRWASSFRVQHKLATRYWANRVVLAGDAAHAHSPVGGQGLNTGVADAFALAQALLGIKSKDDMVPAFQKYEAQRRDAAQRVLELTHRFTRFALVQTAKDRLLRRIALGGMRLSKLHRERLVHEMSGLGRMPSALTRPHHSG